MIAKKLIHAVARYLINFIQIQLIVTLVALPILVAWGLPLSLMTFVGNLIFAPVLAVFLVLSSLVLFAQLFALPYGSIAYVLNHFVQWWDTGLNYGSPHWLLTYAYPGRWILWVMGIGVFVILWYGAFRTAMVRCGVMIGILCVEMGILFFKPQLTPIRQETLLFGDDLYINQLVNKKLCVIDQGFFAQKKTPAKAIEFELKPYLIKKFGSVKIATLVVGQPGTRSFMGAQEVCAQLQVDEVVIPFFMTLSSKRAWESFFTLMKFLKEKNIRVRRCSISQIPFQARDS